MFTRTATKALSQIRIHYPRHAIASAAQKAAAKNLRTLYRTLAITLAALTLSACSEDILLGDVTTDTGSGFVSNLGKQISTLVSKGPVSGSSCNLYNKDDSKLAGPVTTGTDGRADFGRVRDLTNSDIIYVKCTGGSYTDEASGSTKSAPSEGMRGGLMADEETITVVITPATEVAFRKAETSSDLDDLETYNKNVAKALGLGDNFQPAETEPTDINSQSAGDDSSGQYAVLLATLSQLNEDGSLGDEIDDILDNLEKCIDAASGTMDNTCVNELINSIDNLQSNSKVNNKVSDATTDIKNNLDSDEVKTDDSDDTFVIYDTTPAGFKKPADVTADITLNGEGFDRVKTATLTDHISNPQTCTIDSTSDDGTGMVLDCSGLTTSSAATKATLTLTNNRGNKVYRKFELSSLPYNTPTFSLGSLSLTFDDDPTDDKVATCPSNATPTYSSSNTSVATVNTNGRVTPADVGSSTITVSCAAVSNAYLADDRSYQVEVAKATPVLQGHTPTLPTYRTNKDNFDLTSVDSDLTINITACNTSLSFAEGTDSSNIIASVSTTGLVTLTDNTGTATITVQSKANANCNASNTGVYNLTVIDLSPDTPTFASAGPLSKKFADGFSNAISGACPSGGTVVYSTSDTTQLDLDTSSGDVTVDGVGDGTAVVTATCPGTGADWTEDTATYTINITKATPALENLTPQLTYRTTDTSFDLTIVDSDLTIDITACDTNLTYAEGTDSSNIIASVSTTGLVTLTNNRGDATIDVHSVANANCNASNTGAYNLTIADLSPDTPPAFTTPGPLNKAYGDSFRNAISGACPSSGIVSYSTDDDEITLNATTGDVTIDSVGDSSADVTATCPGTGADWTEDTATYTINITKATPTLAWDGFTGVTGANSGNTFNDQTGDVTIDVTYRLDYATLTQTASVTPTNCTGNVNYTITTSTISIGDDTVDSNGAVDLSQDATNNLGFAGTNTIRADYSDDANCGGDTPISYSLIVHTVTNDATFDNVPSGGYSYNYSDHTFDISGDANCDYGNPTYSTTTGSYLRVEAGDATVDVTIKNTGTDLNLRATCPAKANQYTAGATADQTVDVAKATTLTLTIKQDDVTVDSRSIHQSRASDPNPTTYTITGLRAGDDTTDLTGNGTLDYTSDDPSIATVNSSGSVDPSDDATGDVTIYLTYKGNANANYSDATADYTLTVCGAPLDATASYSLRRVICDGTQDYAIQVRRGGDDVTMDIPFDANGDLSQDALTTFVSAGGGDGNGYVAIWYDQSGNGRDLSQGTDNKQPQIVSSGSVLTRGGKPAIQFDGANDNLWAAESSLHNGHNNQSVFILADSTGSNDKDLLVTYSGASAVTIVIETHGANNLRNIYAYNGSQDTNLYTTHGQFTGNQKLITFIATPTQYISRVDGANQQTGTRTKSGPDRDHKIVVGSLHNDTLRFYDGRMQEILLYDSDKSADMAAIETNMDDYWK